MKENKVCERVCVTNCNLTSYSAGIRIGWINDGVIRNCTFSNLVMTDTSVGIACFIPDWANRENGYTDVGREATLVENMSFNNIVMQKICGAPIMLVLHPDECVKIDAVRNLSFSDLTVSGASFFKLEGRKEQPLQNIRFSNCQFIVTDGSEIPNINVHGATLGVINQPILQNIENLQLNGVSFTKIDKSKE